MPTTERLQRIALQSVVAGDNDRTQFAPDQIDSLADAIAAVGLVQPITVRPRPDGLYEIVAGERRFRAVQQLGWEDVDVFVRDLDDDAASAVMLVENVHRVDLHPMDEAAAYRKRLDSGATLDQVSEQTGVPVGRIRFRLELLNLEPVAAHLVRTGELPVRWGLHLSRVDSDRQRLALRAYNSRPMMFDEWKDLLDELREAQGEQALLDMELLMLEEEWTPTVRRVAKPTKNQLADMLATVAGELPTDSPLREQAFALLNRLEVTA